MERLMHIAHKMEDPRHRYGALTRGLTLIHQHRLESLQTLEKILLVHAEIRDVHSAPLFLLPVEVAEMPCPAMKSVTLSWLDAPDQIRPGTRDPDEVALASVERATILREKVGQSGFGWGLLHERDNILPCFVRDIVQRDESNDLVPGRTPGLAYPQAASHNQPTQ